MNKYVSLDKRSKKAQRDKERTERKELQSKEGKAEDRQRVQRWI